MVHLISLIFVGTLCWFTNEFLECLYCWTCEMNRLLSEIQLFCLIEFEYELRIDIFFNDICKKFWLDDHCMFFFFQIHRLFTHVPASCDFNIWIPLLVLFFWIYYNSLYWYWASTLVFAEFWREKFGSLLLFFMHLAYLPTCSWLLHKV